MMFGFGPFGWGGMVFGSIFMIFWWIFIVVVIVALVRWIMYGSRYHHHYHGEHGSGRALDILRERYAKGEIGKEEFEQKKKDLSIQE